MNEKQIKRHLEDRGFRISDLARELIKTYAIEERSADSMLRDLIAGRRWFPVYAEWLEREYGISVNRPQSSQPVRERLRAA